MSSLAPPAILPADDRHLDDLMWVMRRSFEPEWGEAWTRMQLASALAMDGSFARLARGAGDAPLGFSLCRRILDEAELLLVAVAPEARGQGLGRALVVRARKDSRNLGCSRMFLEVRENNQQARNLYHAAGFFDVGRRPDYYSGEGGRRFGAVTMQCNIVD